MVVTLHRRQDDTLATVNGLSGGKTVSGIDSIGQTLALDDPTNTPHTSVPTDALGLPTITLSSSASKPTVSASQQPVAASSEKFSNGMVVGICVGAFAGALAIILVGVVIYRKSAPKPHQRRPSQQHRRIESQSADSWEGKYPQTRQIPPAPTTASTIAPMEKLTASMFIAKTPSMRSEHSNDGDSHNFAEYRPDLAQEMAEKDGGYLGRIDTGGATLSWGDADGGRMSPMFSRAIPTPQAHDSPLHHAQSAEVINPFGADDDDDDEPERRKSQAGNPFFGSRPPNDTMSVQRSRSRASRASSHKGKSRANGPSSHGHDDNIDDMYADYSDDDEEGYYSAATNPFSDPTPNQSTATLQQAPLHIENHPYAAPIFQTSATPPPPSPMTPRPLPSPATPVNDPHAIKGLLAALEIPDGGHNLSVVQGGRGTVMSAQSATSAYSDIDSAVAGQFPAPPA